MILVDTNLLLYAEDALSSQHTQAREWWDAALSGNTPIALPWIVLIAFIRIATNRRVFVTPLTLDQAIARVQSWMDQPNVSIVSPTARHWDILQNLLKKGQAVANLTSDAHIAALAVEHGATLHSTDSDFSRFPGLKWINPLA